MTTTLDYDAPRNSDLEDAKVPPLDLAPARAEGLADDMDDDGLVLTSLLGLRGADLSGEELTVQVIPKRSDEFTCTVCYLVLHRSRRFGADGGRAVCVDCC